MIDIDKNTESQLHIFEFLAEFKNPKNKRQRLKKTPFKTLQAIFQITRTNLNKQRYEHFPSKELIADVAGISRKEVTEFITSDEMKIFCDVHRSYDSKRKRFNANRYVLKDWVFKWFRLFWRSGMMKHFRKNYDWWISDFAKRIKKWLVPLVQKGHTIDQIYDSVVNKLSTEIRLKGAAAKSLKGADIKPSGVHEAYGTEMKDENAELGTKEATVVAGILSTRLHFNASDIHQFLFKNSLHLVKKAALTLCYRIEILKWNPTSSVRALQAIINEIKEKKAA